MTTAAIRNEQTKYLATAANNLGVASVVTGAIGPVATYLTGVLQIDDPLRLASTCVVWLAIGISCIFASRRVLEELE